MKDGRIGGLGLSVGGEVLLILAGRGGGGEELNRTYAARAGASACSASPRYRRTGDQATRSAQSP